MKKTSQKFKSKKLKQSFAYMLGRAITLSFSNLWRNKFLTAATVLVMAIIIFIFNIILAVNFITQSALEDLTQKVDIVIYLKDNTDYYQIQQITGELEKLEGITNVTYTSKSEALKIVSKTHPKTAEFLQRYGIENPLPQSINVTTERPELHIMVQQFLNQEKYRHLLANVVTDTEAQSTATEAVSKNLINLSNAINQIIFWIFVIFIVGAIFIISNAIQLTIYTRQREIYIMRLVGATRNFIRLPFLFEGLFYGIVSSLIAALLLFILAMQIKISEISIAQYFESIPVLNIFYIELIAAALLGVFSSFLAVYRYLRNKLIIE